MPYILALDQGTSSSRALLFDASGEVRALAQREFTQHYPEPGFVEHDALEIWATQLACGRECLAKAGLTGADVAAVAITNQRETTVVWDRATGIPVAPAIVWQDRRTTKETEAREAAGLEPLICAKTGLRLDPYFSATKIEWILDHVPGARARAEKGELLFGTIDTWLLWNLTKGAVHATDVTNASRTLLCDLRFGQWDDELLDIFRVPRTMLPKIVPSSGIVGYTDPEWFGAAIPVAGIAGDQQAATFGEACFRPGMVKNTYGTGGFLLMNTGTELRSSVSRLISTAAYRIGDAAPVYALEGSVFIAGAVVQWLRDQMGFIKKSNEIEGLARTVDDTAGVYFVPAFTGLGAPHWDPQARGAILGLTRGTTRAHIARAAVEAIAFQSAEVVEAMARDAVHPVAEIRADGGACRNDLLMQFQADITGIPVVRTSQTETTATGAAYLAGIAVGIWSGTDEIASLWRAERTFEPAMSADERQSRMNQWARAVGRARKWS
ncbi:glycerol kinase GlpK [Sutterella sp.]|uniref:glycerol kinase GlpK n=1 Tax=Sutterella sp. TaxID=1981025 RepID=UPI0026E033E6|nr:glycerol kinase GlpK [Sutterella sp.]MDO5532548.1 glycerol kinase GlpK [Sutterella sp.]